MSGFKDSILKGMAAHEKAVQAAEEIEAVVADLRRELSQLTDGCVGIRIRWYAESSNALTAFATSLEILSTGTVGTKRYEALVLHAIDLNNTDTQIARWDKSAQGYPVTLRTDGQKWDCFDRKSLVTALQTIMATPEVGEAISSAWGEAKRAKNKKQEE